MLDYACVPDRLGGGGDLEVRILHVVGGEGEVRG